MVTMAKSEHYELIENDGKYEIYEDGRKIFFSIGDNYACRQFEKYALKAGDYKIEIDLRYWMY